MKNTDRLRGLEIRFYLVCYDIIHLTKPITTQNLINFFDFLEKIDFTNSLNYSILKTLASTIFTENTNIQPNKVELCNFCYTHKVKLRDIRKYVSIPKTLYDATVSQINSEYFYQPTHLKEEIYPEIEKFLEFIEKLKHLGVTINAEN